MKWHDPALWRLLETGICPRPSVIKRLPFEGSSIMKDLSHREKTTPENLWYTGCYEIMYSGFRGAEDITSPNSIHAVVQ